MRLFGIKKVGTPKLTAHMLLLLRTKGLKVQQGEEGRTVKTSLMAKFLLHFESTTRSSTKTTRMELALNAAQKYQLFNEPKYELSEYKVKANKLDTADKTLIGTGLFIGGAAYLFQNEIFMAIGPAISALTLYGYFSVKRSVNNFLHYLVQSNKND